MKRVLWLASWYPNSGNLFEGDFIQRHAYATSIYQPVYLLHVANADKTQKDIKVEKTIKGALTEHIIYNYRSTFPVLGKLFTLINYYVLYTKAVVNYIRQYGKPDIVHVHVPIKSGTIALWMKYKFKLPYLLTEHYGIYNKVLDERFENRSFLFKFFTRQIIQRSMLFLPVSRQIGEAINQMVTKKSFKVIKNTVDTSLFNYTPPANTLFRFVHVSNMHPLKNILGIIDASLMLQAKHIRFELILVGAISEQVYQYAETVGILNTMVRFTGELCYGDVAEQVKKSHAFILFSRTENMPCVVLESLCCGRPVIASRVGGVPEVVHSGNGTLVDSEDVPALADAMIAMMENYSSYDLKGIAEQAQNEFSYHSIGKQISDAYDEGKAF